MKRTFQSFVFGCRVNEAERIRFDNELRKAGFTVDLNSPAYSIINTCAITGKAEREAKQLIYSLRKQFPKTKVVITGCSATYWAKRFPEYTKLVDIVIPNSHKADLASLLLQTAQGSQPASEAANSLQPLHDKFRQSNRLLVKIQDGCHRFCNYCIVPYLRGNPQSQTIHEIISYINSFDPIPSEVILSAINTESFGKDTKETMDDLIRQVLAKTSVKRIGFGSIHPWSLTDEFLRYYRTTLAKEPRFVQFFHVPIQSGSQTMLTNMRREYDIAGIMQRLEAIKSIRPDAFIATDIIVGYLGETDALFDETYTLLTKSPISRFHVFPFSNRMHTAAYYLKRRMEEPSPTQKKERAEKLRRLSDTKYKEFKTKQIGAESDALVIAAVKGGVRVVTHNNIELVVKKYALPGDIIHVTIKD